MPGAAFYPVLVDAIARDLLAEGMDVEASKRRLTDPPPAPPDPSLYRRAIR